LLFAIGLETTSVAPAVPVALVASVSLRSAAA